MKTIIKILVPAVVIFSVGEVYLRKSEDEAKLHCEKESTPVDQFGEFNIAQYTGATATSLFIHI